MSLLLVMIDLENKNRSPKYPVENKINCEINNTTMFVGNVG